MIEWFKRCKRDDSQMAERRIWSSRCGHYKVVESNIRYGRKFDNHGNYLGYPITSMAMVLMEWGWNIISHHRKQSAAVKALEYFHDKGHAKPKPKTKRKKVRVDNES